MTKDDAGIMQRALAVRLSKELGAGAATKPFGSGADGLRKPRVGNQPPKVFPNVRPVRGESRHWQSLQEPCHGSAGADSRLAFIAFLPCTRARLQLPPKPLKQLVLPLVWHGACQCFC
jgi:hypothetical protein